MSIHSADDLLRSLEQFGLLSPSRLRELTAHRPAGDARSLAGELLKRGWLSAFQINQLFRGQGATLRLGPYVLLDRLGEGGMGAVYKALQTKLDRVVALKVIRRERINNPGVISRFQREIRAAAQLQHPNVVTVHDAGEEGDTLFLVMEFVEGTDLAKMIKQRGPLPVAEACDYARQAALGLEHIRLRGLVHRDIKPANLLRAAEHNLLKIADLGLARLRGDEGTMTAEGSVLGTPDFLAPEQALDAKSADIRADLYSLGATLYCLLSGQVPYPGGSAMEKLMRHQRETPTPLRSLRPDVPAVVESLTARLMARNPADRFQTPGEAAVALAEVLGVPAPAHAAIPVAVPVSAIATTAPLATLVGPPLAGQETVSSLATTDWNPQKSSRPHRAGNASTQAAAFPAEWRKALLAAGAGLALLLLLIVCWPRSKNDPDKKTDDDDGGANVTPDPTDPFPPGPLPEKDRRAWLGLADRTASVRGASRWQVFSRHLVLQWTPHPLASPDGQRVALSYRDSTVRLFAIDGEQPELILPGENYPTTLAWSPTGRWLAIGDDRGALRIHDAKTGTLRRILQAADRPLEGLAWAPDGRQLATHTSDRELPIAVWDVVEGKRTFKLQSVPVEGTVGHLMSWSHDGRRLAAAHIAPNNSASLLTWETAEGKPGTVWKDLGNSIDGILWDIDNKRVIAHMSTGVKSLDLAGEVRTLSSDPPSANSALVQDPATGNLIWVPAQTRDAGPYFRTWDRKTEKTGVSPFKLWPGGPGLIWFRDGTPMGLEQRGNRHRIAPLSEPPAVEQPTAHFSLRGGSLDWMPDGAGVGAVLSNGGVQFWDASDGKSVLEVASKDARAYAWSPDGKRLAMASERGLRLYRPWDNPKTPLFSDKTNTAVAGLVWSRDGKRLIVEGGDNTGRVEVWDPEKFERVGELTTLPGRSYRASPDGRWVTAVAKERELQLWDLDQMKKTASSKPGIDSELLAWNPDSQLLAAPGRLLRVLAIPECKDARALQPIPGSRLPAWSGDSKALALDRGDLATRRWLSVLDTENGEERLKLMDTTHVPVEGLAWSLKAPLLAAVVDNHTLRVWDVKEGRLRWQLLLLPGPRSAVLGGDGSILHADAGAEEELVYVVERSSGNLQIRTPSEFREKHPPE